ncbi:MAG: hypothetical protein PHV43_02985 [Candidatus Colwellbacteria bacterium]|nr:hypothetical protein [Candidatus Colwellbacteria bacterium]
MPSQLPQYTQGLRDQFTSSNLAVGWPKRFFTFTVILFAAVFLVYIGLAFGYRMFLNRSIDKLDSELESLSSEITDEQREELATLYSQVTNVRTLLENHVATSKAFTLLESITYPKVAFLTLDLDMKDRRVVVSGVSPSYDGLTAQLALLENEPNIEEYNLEDSSWDDGVVQFKINMTIDRNVFEM